MRNNRIAIPLAGRTRSALASHDGRGNPLARIGALATGERTMAHHLAKGAPMSDTGRDFDETARRAAERAAKGASELADEAGERLDDLGDRVGRAAGAVGDAVGDAVRDARASATGSIDAMSAQASAAASEARGVLEDGVAYVKARYRENPVAVIAIGAAAILGVCLVIKAIMRR